MIRDRWLMLPKLIRFMLTHIANGIVIGCCFVFVLIWFDVWGFGTVLAKDASGLATALLFLQTSFTFGAVSMGIAVMNLGEE